MVKDQFPMQGPGSISGLGNKIPHTVPQGQHVSKQILYFCKNSLLCLVSNNHMRAKEVCPECSSQLCPNLKIL